MDFAAHRVSNGLAEVRIVLICPASALAVESANKLL